jgi:hypothetical protein
VLRDDNKRKKVSEEGERDARKARRVQGEMATLVKREYSSIDILRSTLALK